MCGWGGSIVVFQGLFFLLIKLSISSLHVMYDVLARKAKKKRPTHHNLCTHHRTEPDLPEESGYQKTMTYLHPYNHT